MLFYKWNVDFFNFRLHSDDMVQNRYSLASIFVGCTNSRTMWKYVLMLLFWKTWIWIEAYFVILKKLNYRLPSEAITPRYQEWFLEA